MSPRPTMAALYLAISVPPVGMHCRRVLAPSQVLPCAAAATMVIMGRPVALGPRRGRPPAALSAALLPPRVQGIPQPVADEIDAQHRQGDRRPRGQPLPRPLHHHRDG